MTKHWTALTFAVATTLALATAEAAAPQKSVFSFRGLTGQASWFDVAGCQLTSVQVLANENVSHSVGGGPPVTTDDVTVIYTLFDVCTGQFRIGSGSGPGTIDGSLRAVTITAAVPINDSSLGQVTASVDVTLTATGAVTRGVNNFHVTSPTLTEAVRSVGATTAADSSGSVVVAGTDLVVGLGGATGAISETNGGTVTIFR